MKSTNKQTRRSSTAPSPSAAAAPKPKPWIRFWARVLDIFLHSYLLGIVWYMVDSESLLQMNSIISSFVFFLAWVVLETLYMTLFGTTLGKALFRIKVLTEEEERLTARESLKRSALVWLRGMGAGIGIITVVTNAVAFFKLRRDGVTSWDREMKLQVTHRKLGLFRSLLALALVAFMLISVTLGMLA